MANIFETAARIIPLLQQAQWREKRYRRKGLPDKYITIGSELASPLDITGYCNSVGEAAMVAQLLTCILYEVPYRGEDKDGKALSYVEKAQADGKEHYRLQVTLRQSFNIQSFCNDRSLALPSSTVESGRGPQNLRDAFLQVRKAEASKWRRLPEGDCYEQMLPASHGTWGTALLYTEQEVDAINAMLEKSETGARITKEDLDTEGVRLTVKAEDAKAILVDILGLDPQALGLHPGRTGR